MLRNRALLALPTVLALLVLAACGQGTAAEAPAPDTPATEAAAPENPAPENPAPENPAPENPAPEPTEMLAYVREVDASALPVRIVVDEIQMLTGSEAVDAAHADGELHESETSLPNDFYIRNSDAATQELSLVGNAVITPLTMPGEPEQAPWTPQQFADVIADGTGPAMSPYTLVLVDGEVVEIREVYIP